MNKIMNKRIETKSKQDKSYRKNKLADTSVSANLKNFLLNFAIAIVWLVKSLGKYARKFFNKRT